MSAPVPGLPPSPGEENAASTTPVRDYADTTYPGATPDYLVIPRSLAQSMPLGWQKHLVGLLDDLHDAYRNLEWPQYQVMAAREELLTDLDEEQLAATGFIADIDTEGELVYRDLSEQPVPDAHTVRVLAPIIDPIPPAEAGRIDPRPADDRIS